MNKQQLIKIVAGMTKESQRCVEDVINATIFTICTELKENKDVHITGFGRFETFLRKARRCANPQKPGETISIPDVSVAKFRTGHTLKNLVKKAHEA